MSKNLLHKITVLTQILLCFSPVFSKSNDILTKSDVLSIDKTLISATGKFELGFFQLGTPTKYYVGIKYKDIPSDVIIWVANRDSPSFTDLTLLKFDNHSNIVLYDGESKIIWQTNNKLKGVNPVLQLLDSGNLVIREAGDSNMEPFIWQSFDYPTDTLLPGQKFGFDIKTGLDRRLVSWAAMDDPSPGNFSLSVDYKSDHEIYLKKGDRVIFRSGPYDGTRFSGVQGMKMGDEDYNFTFYSSSDEVYYMTVPFPQNVAKTKTHVTCDGIVEDLIWVSDLKEWTKFWYARQDQCDYYGLCGPFGVCNPNAMFICECPRGFKPKDSYAWKLRDWSGGCVRNTKLDCKSDGFLTMNNMKLPDTLSAFIDKTLNLDQCRDACKENCSCTAYGNSEFGKDIGPGCLIWTNNLVDMRVFPERGQTLYIRLSSTDLESSATNGFTRIHKVAIGIGISIAVTLILSGLIALIIWNRRNSRNLQTRIGSCNTSTARTSQEILYREQIITSYREFSGDAMNADDVELPIFDLHSIAVATDYFSEANTLGQGGFGRVYKGVMLDGQEVAVKRLSKESGQGSKEFMNEVRLIAKLQHRNLVRLLGCCVDMDEKIIIYEYLQNRSLDCYLFDKTRNALLIWETRFNIICGVARGLLYLHQDSRYRIIHRDLKASNILLDVDMNPKISDFGMARIFGGDETQANTMRIVGTYGYMAPEFAMDGLFSIKSDVFSFGVLVLEILSGTKNRGTFCSNNELNLLGHAWEQWRDGKGKESVDKSMGEAYSIEEVLRCLQVGLLCVQERPEDRPTMGSVVLMLSSESMSLPLPKLPGFRMGSHPCETDSSSTKHDQSVTVNQVTVSVIDPR